MPPAHQLNARLAAEAEARGDALTATVRWCLAADDAPDAAAQVAALAAARRCCELALHQAAWLAVERRRERPLAGAGWRALARAAGLPLQTMHRRYHAPPPVLPPRRAAVSRWDVERVIGEGAQDGRSPRGAPSD